MTLRYRELTVHLFCHMTCQLLIFQCDKNLNVRPFYVLIAKACRVGKILRLEDICSPVVVEISLTFPLVFRFRLCLVGIVTGNLLF